jgi:predicted lysophospholipase L1 biosynthesis ABC-type transport system permease subunit
VDDGAVRVALDLGANEDAAVEVADHPASLPLLRGSDNAQRAEELGSADLTLGLDGYFIPADTVGAGVLAQLLRAGAMADLPYAVAATSTAPVALDLQVWLAPDADPGIRAVLAENGITVLGAETVADRESELGRSGDALALRLFLIAALAALALGAGTLLAQAYVVLRRRAYELAALRTLGASRRDLIASGRREQLVLAAVGVGLGAVTGLVSAALALGPLLAGPDTPGPPVWLGPAWAAVLALIAAVLVALAVVADLGARRTVDRAQPDLLRQVQE